VLSRVLGAGEPDEAPLYFVNSRPMDGKIESPLASKRQFKYKFLTSQKKRKPETKEEIISGYNKKIIIAKEIHHLLSLSLT
jgi:hypothetical protein